jgi:hypothetical protein
MTWATDRLCELEDEPTGSVITGNTLTDLQGEGTKPGLGG